MDESKNEKMTSLAGASSEEIARAIADVGHNGNDRLACYLLGNIKHADKSPFGRG